MRQLPSGTSIFVGVPGFSTDLSGLAARSAGAHLFTDVDCNVYGTGRIFRCTPSQDGPVTLDTGRPDAVQDVLTGETIGRGPKLVLQ